MYEKLISPAGVPVLVLAIAYLLQRIKNRESQTRPPMGFWFTVALWIAGERFALAWHYEIGSAWQMHPTAALAVTFVAFVVISIPLMTVFVRRQKNIS
jgi:hypothetical protein